MYSIQLPLIEAHNKKLILSMYAISFILYLLALLCYYFQYDTLKLVAFVGGSMIIWISRMIVNYKKVGIIELNESRIVVHANEHRVVHDIPGLTTIEIFVLEVEGERNGRMSFANGSGNYLELGVDRTIIKYQFFLAEEHVVLLRNLLDSWRQHKVSFTAKSASRFRIH